MKQPNECNTISEIRTEIDRIDKLIVALIGERYSYVKEAVRFKSNKEEVKAVNRYKEVLNERRTWATEAGLNADIIEKLYADLIQHFIAEELKLLEVK